MCAHHIARQGGREALVLEGSSTPGNEKQGIYQVRHVVHQNVIVIPLIVVLFVCCQVDLARSLLIDEI